MSVCRSPHHFTLGGHRSKSPAQKDDVLITTRDFTGGGLQSGLCDIIFWETPVSFPVKKKKTEQKTCWLKKINFKSKFVRGINNYGLDCISIYTVHTYSGVFI